ncbi:MAG: hypothetical protein ACTS2F_17345 [Thainema sp.]
MKIKRRYLLFRLSLWLTAELWLSLLGLDHLADYSEYLHSQNEVVILNQSYDY